MLRLVVDRFAGSVTRWEDALQRDDEGDGENRLDVAVRRAAARRTDGRSRERSSRCGAIGIYVVRLSWCAVANLSRIRTGWIGD